MKTIYLLSGGGALGAFQAGVLRSLQDGIDSGVIQRPSAIVGISVGALNATLAAMNPSDFGEVRRFWRRHIREPRDIARQKSTLLRILPGLIRSRFNGLMDAQPLYDLIDKYVDVTALRDSSVEVHVGAVNLSDGRLVYETQYQSGFMTFLRASSAIPVVFPLVDWAGGQWVDGGLVEVAPVSKGIELGADRIVVILCQPENAPAVSFDESDPVALAGRLMDIATDTIIRANVRAIEAVNKRLKEAQRMSGANQIVRLERDLYKKRLIDVDILRPSSPLGYTTGNFDRDDIEGAISHGLHIGDAYVRQFWPVEVNA